jgi:hypothetical protein
VIILAKFLANVSPISLHDYGISTCLGFLGWNGTNRIPDLCAILPKVTKESKAAVAIESMIVPVTCVFNQKLHWCTWPSTGKLIFFTQTLTHTHTHKHTLAQTHMHTYTHTHKHNKHTLTRTHAHTHTDIHIQSQETQTLATCKSLFSV